MGVIKKYDCHYDMSCDRCGALLSEDLVRRDPSMSRTPWRFADGFDVRLWDRVREGLLKSGRFEGWRFNPSNRTVVCPACSPIDSEKGGEA